MRSNFGAIVLVSLCMIGGAIGGRYSGQQTAQSQGDDPNASGLLNLQTTRDTIIFNSTLFNSFNVTGVHLHLSSPRGAVFGGPLILALTNTTAANGQPPVSSSGSQPLIQNGQRTSSNLQANAMLATVRQQLGGLGVTGNDVRTIGDVANLIEAGLVYTDVHTTVRVSPEGLIRGAVTELACPFPSPNPPSGNPSPPSTNPSTPTGNPPPTLNPSPPNTNPTLPTNSAPPAPTNQGNPCYCAPQQGVGSDGYQYCFNFVEATSAINCNPPAGARCNIIYTNNNQFTSVGGPVYQCRY